MIRISGDLVIQIFGIVFGGAAVRKNVLHADPVGRRIFGWLLILDYFLLVVSYGASGLEVSIT